MLKSKYDGKCKDCGAEHKIGDLIEQNSNDHWCKNGKNCQGAMELEGSPKGIDFEKLMKEKEPTPEELLSIARELNHQDSRGLGKDAITEIYNEAAHAAISQLIRQAAINNIMDKAGIKHPGRVAFTESVLRRMS